MMVTSFSHDGFYSNPRPVGIAVGPVTGSTIAPTTDKMTSALQLTSGRRSASNDDPTATKNTGGRTSDDAVGDRRSNSALGEDGLQPVNSLRSLRRHNPDVSSRRPAAVVAVDRSDSVDDMELVEVCRLPGESVGMDVVVECMSPGSGTSRRVRVVSVTPGSPADRASQTSESSSGSGTGSSNGIRGLRCGDEIVEINGKNLRLVRSNDEVLRLVDEMPLRLLLLIKRSAGENTAAAAADTEIRSRKPFELRTLSEGTNHHHHHQTQQQQQPPAVGAMTSSLSSSFTKQTCTPSIQHEGFEIRRLAFRKAPGERLGLRLELASLGLRRYFQIREILEGGVFSSRRLLRVGDYLLSFNGQSLEGLDQVACRHTLTRNVSDVELEVLREKPGRTATTHIDDVPDAPASGPVDDTVWYRTSFDDIVVTDANDCLEQRGSSSSASTVDPGQLFAHNKMRLSFRTSVSRDSQQQARERRAVNDDDERNETTTTNVRHVETDVDNDEGLSRTSSRVDGQFDARGPAVDRSRGLTEKAVILTECDDQLSSIDEPAYVDEEDIKFDDVSSSSTRSPPRPVVPTTTASASFAVNRSTSDDAVSSSSSPPPPPLPASLPPNRLPAGKTLFRPTALDVFGWSTISDDGDDHRLPDVDQLLSMTTKNVDERNRVIIVGGDTAAGDGRRAVVYSYDDDDDDELDEAVEKNARRLSRSDRDDDVDDDVVEFVDRPDETLEYFESVSSWSFLDDGVTDAKCSTRNSGSANGIIGGASDSLLQPDASRSSSSFYDRKSLTAGAETGNGSRLAAPAGGTLSWTERDGLTLTDSATAESSLPPQSPSDRRYTSTAGMNKDAAKTWKVGDRPETDFFRRRQQLTFGSSSVSSRAETDAPQLRGGSGRETATTGLSDMEPTGSGSVKSVDRTQQHARLNGRSGTMTSGRHGVIGTTFQAVGSTQTMTLTRSEATLSDKTKTSTKNVDDPSTAASLRPTRGLRRRSPGFRALVHVGLLSDHVGYRTVVEFDAPAPTGAAAEMRRSFNILKLHSSLVTISNDSVLLASRLTPIMYGPFQLPRHRTSSGLFQVNVLRAGSVDGLGIDVASVPEGVVITDVRPTGPVGRNGNIRVGDYLLAINGIDLSNVQSIGELIEHIPLGPVQLVLYAGPSNNNSNAYTSIAGIGGFHQRVTTERPNIPATDGPVTQILAVNTTRMKIVHLTASKKHSDESPPTTTRNDSAKNSSKTAEPETEYGGGGFGRLPPDGKEKEQHACRSVLRQQIHCT